MLCRVAPVLSIKLSGLGETREASELVNPESSWRVGEFYHKPESLGSLSEAMHDDWC
jgi:hypothetical protein